MDALIAAAEFIHRTYNKQPWFISAGTGKSEGNQPVVIVYARETPHLDTTVPELNGVQVMVRLTPDFQAVTHFPARLAIPASMDLSKDRLAWLAKISLFGYNLSRVTLNPTHTAQVGIKETTSPVSVELEPGLTVPIHLWTKPDPSVLEYS